MKNVTAVLSALAVSAAVIGCQNMADLTEGVGDLAAGVGSATGVLSVDQADALKRTTTTIGKSFEEFTPEQEYYIGRSVAATVLAQYPADDDAALNLYLNELGQTLALYSDMPETFSGYHFVAIRSQEVNALSAPSGFVMISHGLLKCCRSEDELAAVVAHEIGHVELRHGMKAIRAGRITSALMSPLAEAGHIVGSQELAELTDAFKGGVLDITGTLVNSGYSRSQEYDADKAAVAILTRAGYDPSALVAVLGRMDAQSAAHPGGFTKTHPAPKDRIANIAGGLGARDGIVPAARLSRFDAVANRF